MIVSLIISFQVKVMSDDAKAIDINLFYSGHQVHV